MAGASRLVALDGIRGVAVLLVVVGHISGTWAPYASNVGVTLFFVLSGFLITSLLVRERDKYQGISFSGFYMRRALRLTPALLLVLAVTPILLWVARDERIVSYWFPALVSGLYLADFVEAADVSLGYFTHMWSLAVEEQFYLVWPIVLVGLFAAVGWGLARSRHNLLVIVASLTGLALTWRVVASLIFSPDRVYYGPDTNAFMLLLGCTLAIAPREKLMRVPSWAALTAVATIAGVSVALPGGDPVIRNWAVVGAALLAAVAISGSIAGNRVLSLRILVWFGTISYGLYLWHGVLLGIEWDGAEADGIWRVGIAAISVGVAWLSFRFFETRIQRRFKPRWERPRAHSNTDARSPNNAAT